MVRISDSWHVPEPSTHVQTHLMSFFGADMVHGASSSVIFMPRSLRCLSWFFVLFLVHYPWPWQQKQHSEGSTDPRSANEGVFECPGPPVLKLKSGVGSAGHLGRQNAHFPSSTNHRCQPQCCSGSALNKAKTSSPWPTAMAKAFSVGHGNGVARHGHGRLVIGMKLYLK